MLVIVMVPLAVAPAGVLAKARLPLSPIIRVVPTGAVVPVPDTAIVFVPLVASLVTVRVPLNEPMDVGLKVTETDDVAPAATVPLDGLAVNALFDTVIPVQERVALPLFVIVKVVVRELPTSIEPEQSHERAIVRVAVVTGVGVGAVGAGVELPPPPHPTERHTTAVHNSRPNVFMDLPRRHSTRKDDRSNWRSRAIVESSVLAASGQQSGPYQITGVVNRKVLSKLTEHGSARVCRSRSRGRRMRRAVADTIWSVFTFGVFLLSLGVVARSGWHSLI